MNGCALVSPARTLSLLPPRVLTTPNQVARTHRQLTARLALGSLGRRCSMRRRGPREWREFLTDETCYVVTSDRLEVLAARNDGNIGR